jgi:tetratricopeptide (TPR) repeat protein
MTMTGHPPAPTADGSSPWAGLSGAALFSGDLLAGVIASDPARAQHARLEVVPIYLLARDRGFRAAAAEHGLAQMVLEPVELQDLIDREPDLVRSPAGLLRARHQVVAFRGRQQLMQDMESWAAGAGFAAWLLHGPGGQGKTRLAQELADRLSLAADRWAWLWLRRDTAYEQLQMLRHATVPLLVIVDYAETRPEQVAAALRVVAGHPGGTPVRMLLLARTAGDWWDSLRASDPVTAELLDGTPGRRLGELEPEVVGQVDAYREAVHGFAASLPRVPGQQHRDWASIAARLASRNAPAPHWASSASALTLHMSALADLLDTAELRERRQRESTNSCDDGGKGPRAYPAAVEDRLLQHEREYWRTSAAAFGLVCPVLSEHALHAALVAAFLVGAADSDSADKLLQRIPALSDQPRDRRDTVHRWIAHLYPPSPGDARPWGGLQPDRLAERFVGLHLASDPGLAHYLIVGADPTQASQVLTVYARAAHHSAGNLGQALTSLCFRHPETLAAPAIEVATQVEAPGPLITALEHLTNNPDASLELLTSLADRLPQASQRLADWAAELFQRLTNDYRRLTTCDPAFRIDLAKSLSDLSNRLAALGRREEALAAISEAVDIRRELAAAHPDAVRPDLASSLNRLSSRLAALGRRGEALAAISEAVDIRRQLATAHPDAFLPDLARSLTGLSRLLTDVGRQQEALAAIREAVDIRRELASQWPDAYQDQLQASMDLFYRLERTEGDNDEAAGHRQPK